MGDTRCFLQSVAVDFGGQVCAGDPENDRRGRGGQTDPPESPMLCSCPVAREELEA